MDDTVARAKELVANQEVMTVATADANGKPWAAPVGYAVGDACTFYWVSNKDALHSDNIRNRPEIAISIWGRLSDGTLDGVYVEAIATELAGDEAAAAVPIMGRSHQPSRFTVNSVHDVLGDSAWRIYKAIPQRVYKRSDADINSQAVTVRTEVALADL